jgi:hypothetical protein
MKKLTKSQIESLSAIHQRGGAVLTSEWVNGSGRYTSRRIVPQFCERIERHRAHYYPLRIQKVFADHPRCQAVVAITNMKGANIALRQAHTIGETKGNQ